MTTLLDHRTTLAYLAYLGYPAEPRTEALQVTRPRKQDRRKGKVTRNVFLCYVCGAAGSGKTSLLHAFANKSFQSTYEPTSKMVSVVNAVDIDGSEKYLVVSDNVPSSNRGGGGSPWCYSCRSSARDTNQRPFGTRRRRTLQMSSSTCTTPATPTLFHISATYGYVMFTSQRASSLISPQSNSIAWIIYQHCLWLRNLTWI